PAVDCDPPLEPRAASPCFVSAAALSADDTESGEECSFPIPGSPASCSNGWVSTDGAPPTTVATASAVAATIAEPLVHIPTSCQRDGWSASTRTIRRPIAGTTPTSRRSGTVARPTGVAGPGRMRTSSGLSPGTGGSSEVSISGRVRGENHSPDSGIQSSSPHPIRRRRGPKEAQSDASDDRVLVSVFCVACHPNG